MKLLMLAGVVCLVACSPDLDPEMAGDWWGTAEVSVQGLGERSAFPTLHVTVNHEDADVRGLCLDGSGDVLAHGVGAHADWRGTLTCPPLADPECPVTLSYSEVAIAMEEGVLIVNATGEAAFCASRSPFALSFLGVHL